MSNPLHEDEPTDVVATVIAQSDRVLRSYLADPGLIQEHANSERRIVQGGYGERQLYELVQNGADEMRERDRGGTIHVVLTATHLYCANQGTPVTPEGAETILRMSVSRKRGGQIGRFGVGVKSVLSVCDTPQFFSVSGSFGFDRTWSAERIRAIHVEAQETPVLRMARPLDMAVERASDPVLDELLASASTVVRLPLLPGVVERLANDVVAFPASFSLFSSHVGRVILEDRRTLPTSRRELRVQEEGERRTLQELRPGVKKQTATWRVFTCAHSPTSEVRSSAGELHDRPMIDISWAVPEYTVNEEGHLVVPSGRGEFWAFFPTTYPTTLSGILNAAWKTNEDRQNLLQGSPLNEELLREAARLVVDSLPKLVPAEDPAAYLPLLPGRTKESPNWADGHLVHEIWRRTAMSPSLPDQDGALRRPTELRLHPVGLAHEWLTSWAEHPGRPRDWVHHSIDAISIRRGKAAHILEAARMKPASVTEWLEALVSDETVEASARAITIAAGMIRRNEFVDEARKARILLTERAGLVAPVAGRVFRRTVEDGLQDDLVYVDPRVCDSPSVTRDLEALGVHEADASGRFAAVVEQGFDGYDAESWTRFWELLRAAGWRRSVAQIQERVPAPTGVLRVRTLDGVFRPMRDCLLPGAVVPADGSRDSAMAVDMGFHSDDRGTLRELGLSDRPTPDHDPVEEPWFQEYRDWAYDRHCRQLSGTASRPKQSRMQLEGARPAGPLHLLTRLSTDGRAAFVAHLPPEGVVRDWTQQFGAAATGRVPIPSPLLWVLTRHGRVRTSLGVAPLGQCVSPRLREYARVLPVADLPVETADRLGLADTLGKVPAPLWQGLLRRIGESEDDEFVGRAYALLLAVGFVFPEDAATRCRIGAEWGTRPDGDIAVAGSRDEYDELVRECVPALLAPNADDAKRMIEDWGMRRVGDVIGKEIRHVPDGEPTLLIEEFPPLRQRLGSAIANLRVLRCSELEEIVRTPNGTRQTQLKSALNHQTVLVLRAADELDVLREADRHFGWKLGDGGCRGVLEALRRQRKNEATQALLDRVESAASVVDKLILLLDEDELRRGLPEGLLESEREDTGSEPDVRRLAELACNAHGDEVLRIHAKALSVRFPADAPSTFSGSHQARQFVTRVGLPDSFAGVRLPSLEPRLEVEGPREFPRLHDYQERLATGLFALLVQRTPQRGMLSLPTGAGKTRVTAEAVIRWIKGRVRLDGPVLWIAQTEELCEQAVQSWRFVWSKVGAEQQLVISRLWSGNESTPVTGRPHLVVATDAKLATCLAADEYAWLRDAALVIVDEAHVAVSRRYTDILGLLGLTPTQTSRHLVGLTATPYRSTNEEETKRLVQRFGNRRIDMEHQVFLGDPYRELQQLGMLSKVEHREIAGATIKLSPDERSSVEQLRLLPKSAEKRLADDHERNRRLVDEIAAMPRDWPVLLFATSVGHAKLVAAKLSDRGIRAAAIDSATPASERRRRIEAFRGGEIRVLTNYGVLTQGFDAPATRAVVVARPTYSPNVYQQMIGRGLRGPRNGGEDTCLILNVRDNIENYGEELAFTGFEHLWSGDR